MGKSRAGNLQEENLRYELENTAEKRGKQLINNGDTFVIQFTDTNRYYEIDKEGNVSDPVKIAKDEHYGDITKGNTCDGSKEKPYQINCIEDLVAFSIMSNGGNEELNLSNELFNNKYVILMKTLDFNSIFSYNDYTTEKYGDLNKNGVIENIKTELTKKDEDCIGFTGINDFRGYFDGKEHEIRNIYQHVNSGRTALFKAASKEIKNVIVTGTIINSAGSAGGICAEGVANIINCKNYANITGHNMVGGIKGLGRGGSIENCENYGNITITGISYVYGAGGGIIGYIENGGHISNCINHKTTISGIHNAGIAGIIGNDISITNCINEGEALAGITYNVRYSGCSIVNCCNRGKCQDGLISSYQGPSYELEQVLNLKNSYNLGECSNSGIIGTYAMGANKTITLNMENCYTARNNKNAIIAKASGNTNRQIVITNIKNTYYDTSKSTTIGAVSDGITGLTEQEIKSQTFVDTLNANIGENSEWNKWKLGKDGYPTFE